MKYLRENLRKHLKALCEEIGPRYYWGPNIVKASEYITSVLSSYSCEIVKEKISLPYTKNKETCLKIISPEEKNIPCLPWAGFLPYFPSNQAGKAEGIELIEFSPDKKNKFYSKKALLLDMEHTSAIAWDILGVEKYNPGTVILIDKSAKDFTHLKYGTSNLLIDIMVMPLFKSNIPIILISAKEGRYLRELLEKHEKILVNYSCFTSEDIARPHNIEASFSSACDILLWVHYDTSWECTSCPGANDNTSSVAVVLELVRILQKTDMGKRIKILFACAEECSAFSGLSYFMDTEDFMVNQQSRMALMMMSTRVQQRVLPVVRPLMRSKYFQSLIRRFRMNDIRVCLELECLGWGRAFYLIAPEKSLFARHYKEVVSKRPLILVPQNFGLETHWINLCKNSASGVLAGEQEGYPFHTPEDLPSVVDIDMMEEAVFLIRDLLSMAVRDEK